MKIAEKISGLYRSTKITLVVCAVFLALVSVVLAVLMLHPVTPAADQKTVTINRYQPVITEPAEDVEITEEPPQTLSTWSANLNAVRDSNTSVRSSTASDEDEDFDDDDET